MSFWKPPRPHRYSRRFIAFATVLYVCVFPTAFGVLHFLRLHLLHTVGFDGGIGDDCQLVRLFGKLILILLAGPAALAAIAGLLKLLLVVILYFERRPRSAAR